MHITPYSHTISLQVKAGSVFDNILVCDEPQYAKEVVNEILANKEVRMLLDSRYLHAVDLIASMTLWGLNTSD